MFPRRLPVPCTLPSTMSRHFLVHASATPGDQGLHLAVPTLLPVPEDKEVPGGDVMLGFVKVREAGGTPHG